MCDGRSDRAGWTRVVFANGGRAEVVYSDEQTLWIYDGATGAVRWSRPMSSGTTIEQPIVADVDGDGQAEIVVNLAGGRTAAGIAHPGETGRGGCRDRVGERGELRGVAGR